MTKLIVILLIGLVFEAVGVVWLSRGLKTIGEMQAVSPGEIARLVGRGATNRHILMGVAFEAAFFGCLLFLMSHGDISFVWPLTSLGFVLTTLAARFVLHEPVSGLRWLGVGLIVIGAGVITYTEKAKKPDAGAPAAQAAPASSANP